MPGRVGNVGDWYASADLYVLTSRFEGLSNTLLESMASGLAAVCFDCDTGPREVVRDGVDGVLVRPNGDVPALCARWTRSWAMTRCVRAWRPPRPMCATVFGQPGVGTLGRTFDGVTRAGR